MAELTENTRFGIKIGSVVGSVVLVLWVGRWWGTLETQRETTAETLVRHEQAITALQAGMADMKAAIDRVSAEQANAKEMMSTVSRNTQALLYESGNIKVALAERGFRIPKE